MCKVLKAQALDLFFALHNLSAARQLPSANGRGTLRNNLLQSIPLAASEDFDVKSVNPLFRKVLNNNPEVEIWSRVYDILTESTTSSPTALFLPNTYFIQHEQHYQHAGEEETL